MREDRRDMPEGASASERDLSTADVAAATDRARSQRSPDDDRERAEGARAGRERADRERADREVAVPHEAEYGDRTSHSMPLIVPQAADELRARWMEIQTGFVDEPRRAVEQADGLVADAIQRLAESFADARASLEREWARGDEVSTEELRRALQRYRTFFGRLLEI